MTLFGFHGHTAAASAATEQASIDIGFEADGIGLAPASHDQLHFVEEFLCDERLVCALVDFAVDIKDAVIKWICKESLACRERN